MVLEKDFKFIDLFSGIGGFHCAMDKFSEGEAQCILASEINEEAKKTYEKYFGITVSGDIRQIKQEEILEYYDVACGGFPCQTFSKAGMQLGFGDPRGTLFKEITRLIKKENITDQPKFLILENVRNLITHDNGVTWNTIRLELKDANYNVIETPIVVGPKDFGIPQIRDRAIIVAVRNDIYSGPIEFEIPRRKSNTTSIYDILETELSDVDKAKYSISKHEEYVLNCWDEFINGIKFIPSVVKNDKNDETQKKSKDVKKKSPKKYVKKEFKGVIGFPIWAFEFGENYDLHDSKLNYQDWKIEFIEKNRLLYKYNKKFIDGWMHKWNDLKELNHTEKKFEWQCGPNNKSIWDGIIQFRPSGIRVKQPTEAPTLVAMVHVPIIGKYKRYLTIKETAKLQSFPDTYDFSNESAFNAYKQLGNAVNVEVIYQVFKRFVEYIETKVAEEEIKNE